MLQKYFVRILAFSRKKHHFHENIGFFSHFFRFLQREFHVVGGTLWVEFQVNLVEKFEKIQIRNSRNSRVHVYRWGYVCAVLEGWDMGCAVLGSWSHSPTRCLGEK